MKIAVSAAGPSLDSMVDTRFGRATLFLILDKDADTPDVCGNDQNLNAAQGAGIQAAQILASQGVNAVITGHCGPKAFKTLTAAGIRVYTGASGTVREMLDKFRKDELTAAVSADVEGHW